MGEIPNALFFYFWNPTETQKHFNKFGSNFIEGRLYSRNVTCQWLVVCSEKVVGDLLMADGSVCVHSEGCQ